MEILLNHNEETKAFPWYFKNDIYIKGQFCWNDVIYNKNNFDQFILSITSSFKTGHFKDVISNMNGNFAILFFDGKTIWGAVDIARSFPIFYNESKGMVSDNADLLREKSEIKKDQVDIVHLTELLLLGYNMLEDTVYTEINQIDAGEYIAISEQGIVKEYYYHHINKIKNMDYSIFCHEYSAVESDMFDRMIQMANGRQIVVALSGGFDSRYVVAMLKDKGYEDVVCFTNGDPQKFEMQFAEEIAKKLGYKWYGIDYADSLGKQTVDQVKDFLMFSNNHSVLPHMAHFMAVKKLIENNYIDEDAVFLTGFCGDLPAGSFVFNEEIESKLKYDKHFLSKMFVYDEYFNYKACTSTMEVYINKIESAVKEIGKVNDFQSFVQVHDAIFTIARPSKMVCNANRVFEYFGHEWLMPLWDREYLSYWYSVPMELRRGQLAYKKYLLENLFAKYNIDMLYNQTHSMPWFFRKNFFRTQIKHRLGGKIIQISYILGIPIKRKSDFNNFIIVAMEFYKRITYKAMVNWGRANLNTMMHIWLCEQLYGNINLKKVKKYIKRNEKR